MSTRTSSQGGNGAAARQPRPLFVGREQELERLLHELDLAAGGQPRLVLVVGEAGIGKTRLLRELQVRAHQRGVTVCAGRGYDEFTVPFLPVLDALGPRLRALPGPVVDALGAQADLVRRFALGADGAEPAVPDPSGERKLRLLLAVSRAVIELARVGPLLFLLDDLHWVDQASLELFAHLVFTVADAVDRAAAPLMILGSTRPVERDWPLARSLARFQREPICHTLELGGLAEADVRTLVRGLGLERASHHVVNAVRETTRGNPLFVQEVVRQLLRRQPDVAAGGVLESEAALLALPLPADVTGALAARVCDLPERPRALLTVAACLGDPFTAAALARVTDADAASLLAALEDAVAQGLVTSDGRAYCFAHPLIRQVLYAELTAARRQTYHLSIASALMRDAGERGEAAVEVTHHLLAAGDAADAATVLRWATRAGDHAFATTAWRTAALFYHRALAADDVVHQLSPRERGTLHARAGQAYFRDQDAEPCLAAFEQALRDFDACGDARGHARALIGKTRAQITLASVAYGTLIDPEPLRDAAARLADEDPALAALVQAELAQVFWTARRSSEAEAVARQALAVGQRHGFDYVCAEALRATWLVQSQVLRVREALDSLQQARRYAQRLGDAWLESHLVQREPLTLTWLGRLDEAVSGAAAADEFTRATHDWGDHSLAQGALTCVAAARGDFAATQHHARQALMMRHRSGYPWAGPTALPALASAQCLRGEFDEADASLALLAEPGEVFAEPGPAVLLGAYVHRTVIEAWRAAGDDGVLASAERLRGIAAPRPEDSADVYALGAFAALMDVADLAGDAALAAQWEGPLALAAERGVVLTTGWVALVARTLGVGAGLRRAWSEAVAWFELAATQAAAMRARPEIGRVALDTALMLVARGRRSDRRRVGELLERAATECAALHLEPLLRRVRRQQEYLAALATIPAAHLTVREEDVLVRVASGRSDAAIARELRIAPDAVERAMRGAMRKLGAADRATALAALEPASAAALAAPASERPPLRIILFSDVQGSTALFERLGDAAARAILREHDAIVRGALHRFGGTELKHTGDGVMVSFVSVTSAMDCAIAIQRALAEHNARDPQRSVRVRIGINAGEPIDEDGQLFGTVVNAAARICAQAHAGQILVADVIRSLAEGKDVQFVDHGWVSLRGLPRRYHLFEVPW
ncbi:MAG: BREX system ATP-binding domain-containing protein [Deltaproteobacteria bacterium]|nr:BREX system ATP-binding domain-containing protein [Deltaproteobacteria bacterium]